MMDPTERFRVVGIHADGRREIRATSLGIGTAETVKSAIEAERKYASVVIEKMPTGPSTAIS